MICLPSAGTDRGASQITLGWKEMKWEEARKEAFTWPALRSRADMTLEGLESVAEVIQREKKLPCKTCGKEVPWTKREDIENSQGGHGSRKGCLPGLFEGCQEATNPKVRDMFQQLLNLR